MVKKRLSDGTPCRKCAQTEDLLRRRGLWDRIDAVVWADEGQPTSPGMQLAARFGVEEAPFFLVQGADPEETPRIYTRALKLIRDVLTPSAPAAAAPAADLGAAVAALVDPTPQDILRQALEHHGAACAIAFSGAEDVALIDMAARTGLPFSVFTLDTGRLHPETYAYLNTVRARYDLDLEIFSPNAAALEAFVRDKGLFSFYEDGHGECCGVRKVAPLERALATRRAWMTGQRADQSPATRAGVPWIQADARFVGAAGPDGTLWKLNPLAAWTSADVWRYLRDNDVPFNPLHEVGYRSLGCAPCTRPVHPGQHEREGRWWWEDATKKECGLHLAPSPTST